MKLYHATFKKNLNSIKKRGLGNTTKTLWDDSIPGVVYLAIDPYIAESYAEAIADDLGIESDIVVLSVSLDDLDINLLKQDSNVLVDDIDEISTYEYHGVIPFEALEVTYI